MIEIISKLVRFCILLWKTNWMAEWFYNEIKYGNAGKDPEILKKGVLFWSTWLADEENFRFQRFKTTKVRNYKFLVKYFFQYFQIFSIFTYNENLLMKSYPFIVIRLLLQRSHPHSWQPDSKKGNPWFPNPSSYAPFKIRSFYS